MPASDPRGAGPQPAPDTNRDDEGRDPVLEAAAAAGPQPAAPPAVDTAALIQALSGGGDPMSLLLSQFSAKAGDDPSMALLNQLLQQRTAPPTPTQDEDDREADDARAAEAEARLADLTAMVDRVYAEVEALRGRAGELADALGACPVCFGSDLLCPRCEGRGRPGGRPPQPEAYRLYVVPANARVRRLAESQRERAFAHPTGPSPDQRLQQGV